MERGHSQNQTSNSCEDDVYLLVLLTWPGGGTNILRLCPHWRSRKLSLQPGLPCHPSPLHHFSLPLKTQLNEHFFFPPAGAAWDCKDAGLAASLLRPRAATCEFAGCRQLWRDCPESEGSKFGRKWPGFSFLASAGGRESTRY